MIMNQFKKIEIPAFLLEQPIGKFYVGKIKSSILIKMCTKDMRTLGGEYDLYQRKLNQSRVPALKSYMQYSRATFPNGIILNAKNGISFDAEKNILRVDEREDAFFIIDGQHRIEALKYYKGEKPFDICIIIFDNISIDDQTEIFVTVNSEQKKVNPTIKQNLKGNDSVDTPEKVVRKIAIALNSDKESPLFNRINFSDEEARRDELKLSLASFMRPIIKKMYKIEKNYEIKDVLLHNGNNRLDLKEGDFGLNKPLWYFYVNAMDDILYIMLLNFFTAIQDVFQSDWKNKDSLISKTTGFDALIMLFCKVLEINKTEMSYQYLYDQLKDLEKFKGKLSLEEVGIGNSAAVRLYKLFLNELNLNEDSVLDLDYFEEL